MKKYILLILSVSCFAQFNPVQWYEFGSNYKPNTFIGGIGDTINTPALLAAKLEINVGRIKKFEVIGTDIQFHVNGGYVIPNSSFLGNTNITYYFDKDGLVTEVATLAFKNTINFNWIKIKNAKKLNNYCFEGSALSGVESDFSSITNILSQVFRNAFAVEFLDFPVLISLGIDAGAVTVSVFDNIKFGCTIKVPIALQTANAGAPDGDLQYAISNRGATVIYYP